MLVRHLFYFVTLAREKHFARAAAACSVAQPTLSAAIRKLEQDLGARLVVRDHRFVRLTPEGEKLLVWGRQILVDYHSLTDDLAGLRKGLTGTLNLGVIPAAMSAISLLTTRFVAEHPAASIDIRSMTSRAIARSLDMLEIDAGVTYLENEPIENVRKVPLYHERYVFIARRGHPATNGQTITWKEAATQRLCLLSEDMQNRRIINKVMASIGVSVRSEVVTNSFLAIVSHLRQGEWASIVPHAFARVVASASDFAALDLVDPVHTQAIGLVLSAREPLSPMAAALAASLSEGSFESSLNAV